MKSIGLELLSIVEDQKIEAYNNEVNLLKPIEAVDSYTKNEITPIAVSSMKPFTFPLNKQ